MRIGGVHEMVAHLAPEFAKLGHTVAVLSHNSDSRRARQRPLSRDRVLSGCEVVYCSIPRQKHPNWRHPERMWKLLLLPWLGSRQVLRFLRAWRPDVVSNHIMDGDPLSLADACRSVGVPVVNSVANMVGNFSRQQMRSLADADALVAIAPAIKDYLAQIVPSARGATVISPGVDWNSAQRAEPMRRKRPFIFSACRLSLGTKAVDTLIRAFALIARDYPEIDLLIAGSGRDRERVQDLITSAGLTNRIALLGQKEHDELWTYYKGARLFAMPSRTREGLPQVFLEAMAAGIPVIGTNVGGVREAVRDGENGFLVKEDDTDGLASAMRRILESPQLSRQMGETGRLLAREYDWYKIAAQYLAVFEACQSAKHHAA
jgi:glycosyltransferase involved in cell wall biosynthesis